MILHSLAVIVELASFKKESAVTLKLSALIVELLLFSKSLALLIKSAPAVTLKSFALIVALR